MNESGEGRKPLTASAGKSSAAGPDLDFWQERFESQRTPWDRGEVNPALAQAQADGLLPRGARVLVPGCGAGHEVAALAAAGCKVTGVDYAPAAVGLTRARLDQAGLQAQIAEADLLDWQPPARFDAIWDQACLCALHPDRWVDYAQRLADWMEPGGRLILLAIQVERDGRREGRIEGPPYHCDVNAVRALFPSGPWQWPPPPYPAQRHPAGFGELRIALVRTPATAVR
ncbi:MAG TPA: methyltransferase domain-containing protein [Burkholderiaceae bacterium]|nr:methyltransferase domain-containing protein [Burkholderiaceae bacterium]